MILVIDNYDSFTWNLVHYLEELGTKTFVIRNDQMTADEAQALKPDGILLSPGPCTPNEAGICLEVLRKAPESLPVLGVCLGHQAIGQAFGGEVIRAREIRHGKISEIRNLGSGLFEGLPQRYNVVRYHSLAVRAVELPESLIPDAWTDDGEIMSIHHKDRPIFGVQFHPESILTEHGHALLKNFLKMVAT